MTLINKRDIFFPNSFFISGKQKVERKNPKVYKVKLLTILQMIYSKTPKFCLIRSHLFKLKKIHKYTVVNSYIIKSEELIFT